MNNAVWIFVVFIVLCMLLGSCKREQKTDQSAGMKESLVMEYFTFEIAGKRVGYYEQSNKDGILYSNAQFTMHGQVMENPFWIKHIDGRVTAYAMEEGQYHEFDQDADVFPSSAINLLLTQLQDGEDFTYRQFNEGKAVVKDTLSLRRSGNRIDEFKGDRSLRHFILKNGQIETYCWGEGVFSHRVAKKEDALRDSLLLDLLEE